MSDPLKELDDDLRTELIAINQMAFKGGEQFVLLQSMLGQAELAIERATAAGYNGVGRTMKLILPLMRARGKYLMEELSNWMAIMNYLDERSKEIEAILGTGEGNLNGASETMESNAGPMGHSGDPATEGAGGGAGVATEQSDDAGRDQSVRGFEYLGGEEFREPTEDTD